jgi:hypothetical protein
MQLKPTIRKVLATSVPYGDAICTRGEHVWAAYSDGVLVCVGATSKEARELYQRARLNGGYGRPPEPMPNWIGGRRDRPRPLRPDEEP